MKLVKLRQQLNNHRSSIILGIIILIGFSIRLYNVQLGFHVDEPNVVERAISMMHGHWHQPWYNWPAQSLMFIYGIIFKIANGLQLEVSYYTLARLVSVIVGTIAIWLIYRIVYLLTISTPAALWSATFLAVSTLAIKHSRFATPDMTMTMLFLVLLYCAIKIYQLPQTSITSIQRYYIYAGIALGVAVATKYTAALGVIPIVFVYLLNYRQQWKWLGWFVLTAFIAHTIANPFVLGDLNVAYQQFLVEAQPTR
jgi:4-amino-4-deoxy-L-arabinose transferase-like glycosyltransferase